MPGRDTGTAPAGDARRTAAAVTTPAQSSCPRPEPSEPLHEERNIHVADLKNSPLDQLHPHPDNPRFQLREDVVERLTAEIAANGFGAEHAILVRPISNGLQVVSGHHRLEAARRAGLSEVPAWVRLMDDDEAFMQLVLSNTQGELSPLEIGVHALKAVPLAQGGRGKRGGLSEYAERAGFGEDSLRQWRAAAQVAENTPDTCREYTDRVRHLYEISKAPRQTWPVLTQALIKRAWTVADTKATVDKIRQFDIPAEHAGWLPLTDITARFLSSGKPSPAAVDQLISTVDGITTAIDRDGTEEDATAFHNWLTENRGKDSWDRRKISDYHVALIREWADIAAAAAEAAAEEDDGPRLPDGIELRLGDFREVLKDIEPGTVDAIITDPPYPAEFLPLYGIRHGHDEDGLEDFREEGLAEIAARILKPGGICAVMVGQSYLPEIFERMTDSGALNYQWTLAYLTPGGQATQLWQRKVNTFWKPILVYVKGQYDGPWIGDVATSDVNDNDKNHHHWGQSESGMADLLDRLTRPGDLVCDPFLGGGTTAVVAHRLGRRFIGCDIDETHITTTTERFEGTGA
jgi:site-specific DNA-methyltransferase (adenine-specific)